METRATELIRAHRARVWAIATDLDRAPERVSGIESIEVLERPASGLVGLTWRETRVMYGRPSSETMRIESARDGWWYEAHAESHGARYRTRVEVEEVETGTLLSMALSGTPVTLTARLLTPLSYLFAGSTRRLIAQDLADIRRAAESD